MDSKPYHCNVKITRSGELIATGRMMVKTVDDANAIESAINNDHLIRAHIDEDNVNETPSRSINMPEPKTITGFTELQKKQAGGVWINDLFIPVPPNAHILVTLPAIYNAEHITIGSHTIKMLAAQAMRAAGIQPAPNPLADLEAKPTMTPEDVWGEDGKYVREDWRSEVFDGNTNLGYWEWVESCRERDQDDPPEPEEDAEHFDPEKHRNPVTGKMELLNDNEEAGARKDVTERPDRFEQE